MLMMIQVPTSDREELAAFLSNSSQQVSWVNARPLDGIVWTAAMITIAPQFIALLKQWLLAREKRNGLTKVQIDGKVFNGFSKKEVLEIIEFLDSHTDNKGT